LIVSSSQYRPKAKDSRHNKQKQKLTASDGVSNDLFGEIVSISGNVAIVGARWNDNNGTNSGAAYVYEKNIVTGLWEQKQKLTASDGAAGDQFGFSVSVSGNVAIVGAYTDDDKGTDSGSAYLYEKNIASGLWEEKKKLTASDGAAGDLFGFSVTVSGNVAIVGARQNISNSGSAYVYEKNIASGLWEEKQKLAASDGAADDQFGYSVSVSGHVAIVSARLDDDNDSNSGSAFIYEKNIATGLWEQKQKLTASDGAAGDQFGQGVSVSGNVTIVSAVWDDDKGTDSGSAYVYEKNITSGLWEQKQKLTASDGTTGDNFGKSVSVSGNVAIVSANNSGSAYLYEKNIASGLWEEKKKLTASDGAIEDVFGNFVSVSGDVAIVGAKFDDDNGWRSGSAYIFEW
jgi:hypothetical protein